jgi:hypothetical protein
LLKKYANRQYTPKNKNIGPGFLFGRFYFITGNNSISTAAVPQFTPVA